MPNAELHGAAGNSVGHGVAGKIHDADPYLGEAAGKGGERFGQEVVGGGRDAGEGHQTAAPPCSLPDAEQALLEFVEEPPCAGKNSRPVCVSATRRVVRSSRWIPSSSSSAVRRREIAGSDRFRVSAAALSPPASATATKVRSWSRSIGIVADPCVLRKTQLFGEPLRPGKSGLNLVIAAIVPWNSTYVADAIDHLRRPCLAVPPELLAHTSPLTWEHQRQASSANVCS